MLPHIGTDPCAGFPVEIQNRIYFPGMNVHHSEAADSTAARRRHHLNKCRRYGRVNGIPSIGQHLNAGVYRQRLGRGNHAFHEISFRLQGRKFTLVKKSVHGCLSVGLCDTWIERFQFRSSDGYRKHRKRWQSIRRDIIFPLRCKSKSKPKPTTEATPHGNLTRGLEHSTAVQEFR